MDSLTRRPTETYRQFIERLKLNSAMIEVKVADLLHNYSTATESLKTRYRWAFQYLTGRSIDETKTAEIENWYQLAVKGSVLSSEE